MSDVGAKKDLLRQVFCVGRFEQTRPQIAVHRSLVSFDNGLKRCAIPAMGGRDQLLFVRPGQKSCGGSDRDCTLHGLNHRRRRMGFRRNRRDLDCGT